MKKHVLLLLFIFLATALFAGCAEQAKESETLEDSIVDYSAYSFTGSSWKRDAEHDEETIRFGTDGSFTYYCACGNSVNDSDACEGYTYNDETKTVTLHCFETIEGMITEIKIVTCTETELQLDFDGEIRIFTK